MIKRILFNHYGWAKQSNYEIDTRVQLIVSGKNISAKQKIVNVLVKLVDIFPMLCAMAGLKIPATLAERFFIHLPQKLISLGNPQLSANFFWAFP